MTQDPKEGSALELLQCIAMENSTLQKAKHIRAQKAARPRRIKARNRDPDDVGSRLPPGLGIPDH